MQIKNCQHINTSLVVVEAFDIYEKTIAKCSDCGEVLTPAKSKNKLSLLAFF